MLTLLLRILAVLTALLIGQASPAQDSLTVAQTSLINVHPRTQLTLNCGDGTHRGAVKYWHTPFGQLRNHGDRRDLDPAVSMRGDGSLFAATASHRHSGLYYCLLRPAARGSSAPRAGRPRRDLAGSGRREAGVTDGVLAGAVTAGVTDGVLAGAVTASVALTFVLGFSAGALSRAHVLRCLRVVSSKVRSLRRRPPTGPACQVTMTTRPDPDDDRVFYDETDAAGDPRTTPCSSCTSPPPPTKPQRSFRHKREESPEPYPSYLEGAKEESQDKDGVEEQGEDASSEDDDDTSNSSLDTEKEREKREDERGSKNDKEGGEKEEEVEGTPSGVPRGRRSRVIRLYQYDDEGQRYSHLPSPAPGDLGPAPRLTQRSLSLTRLSNIMSAATAGPLTSPRRETGRGEEEEEEACPSPPFSPAPVFFKMEF
ncbi:hypothetical protein NHX12_008894 [Muraenolepis orangiensis]|uniref:Ig-like domain-containing protein n=1 Tax=Muraenolepis orangiensis TaxID=630683 RepID=A0A9Q0DMB9_9TELE|nr:hypothetical protein NHX12_008894 [Muraenolepis orangiensis]